MRFSLLRGRRQDGGAYCLSHMFFGFLKNTWTKDVWHRHSSHLKAIAEIFDSACEILPLFCWRTLDTSIYVDVNWPIKPTQILFKVNAHMETTHMNPSSSTICPPTPCSTPQKGPRGGGMCSDKELKQLTGHAGTSPRHGGPTLQWQESKNSPPAPWY